MVGSGRLAEHKAKCELGTAYLNCPCPFVSFSSPTSLPVNVPAKLPSCPKLAIICIFVPEYSPTDIV